MKSIQNAFTKKSSQDTNIAAVISYIIQHSGIDKRPYLKVTIFGVQLLGLLDSGASKTIIGKEGWKILSHLNLKVQKAPSNCRLANNSICTSWGTCDIPIKLEGKEKLIKALLVEDIPNQLILGMDFWNAMELIPHLHSNTWEFASGVSEVSTSENFDIVLTTQQQKLLHNLVNNYLSEKDDGKLGCTTVVEHKIETKSLPIKSRYYPVSPVIQKEIDKELNKMLELGIIEESNSPWSSPVVMIRKKSGDYRMCIDFRKLNSVTVKDSYPLPYISHTLDKLKNARYLSSLDIKSAYWQIPLAQDSKLYTAFTVPGRGLFHFNRLPFGLHNGPATFQRAMDRIIRHDLEPNAFVYLDDVVIVTDTFEKHLAILEKVLQRLQEAGFTLNREKCKFCVQELKYLGYIVNGKGLSVDPEKVSAILDIPIPQTVKEVRRIIGMASWYRRFIPNFSALLAPLNALLKKNAKIVWTSECDNTLRELKERLSTAPVLNCPDYEHDFPFFVQTDASNYGLGAVLTQTTDTGEQVICYLSRSLSRAERSYSATEKECLAVLWAVEKLRPYLEGLPFTVVTDHHSLQWLHNLKDPSGRLARWSIRLQQYDFNIIHRKGKDNIVPDLLSRAVPVISTVNTNVTPTPTYKDKWYMELLEKIIKTPKKYPKFKIHNNQLYRYELTKQPLLAENSWKQVVPKELRKQIMEDAHKGPLSGHTGTSKTLHRIVRNYYWPGMKRDVDNYIRRCPICLAIKVEPKKIAGAMSSTTIPERPWQYISADIFGPLPRSTKGNSYVLAVVDSLTKFILLFPLRKATSQAITRTIEEHVFMLFGVPQAIRVDNGVQFRSNDFRKLAETYKVKLSFNPTYHPQANPTERANRTLKTMIRAVILEQAGGNHRKWDESLAKIGCAMRNSYHETTKYTPYFLNFGREITLRGDQLDKLPDQNNKLLPTERATALNDIFKSVQKNIQKLNDANKKRYDLRHRPVTFEIGDFVWKKNFVLSDATKYFSSKLAPAYIGPYRIQKRLNPWTYELVDDKNKTVGVWNIKDLKAHPPDINL